MTRTIARDSRPGGAIPDAAAPGPFGTGTWTLPWSPTACGLARTAIRDVLPQWDLGDLVPVAELLVSELVCNALRHGAGPLRLTLERVPDVRCTVSDGSTQPPRLSDAGSEDEGGRGLALVDTLAARWGYERGLPLGKTVWFELSAGADEPGPGGGDSPDEQSALWRDGSVVNGPVALKGGWKGEAA